jgi:hypothetical protein
MITKPDDRWQKAAADLPEALRPLLREMREDYIAASKLHVPGWTGGPNPKILAELIKRGWRK